MSTVVRAGFEPAVPLSRYTHFPGVLLQPLGHLTILCLANITLFYLPHNYIYRAEVTGVEPAHRYDGRLSKPMRYHYATPLYL